jgi:hypothetical protein
LDSPLFLEAVLFLEVVFFVGMACTDESSSLLLFNNEDLSSSVAGTGRVAAS